MSNQVGAGGPLPIMRVIFLVKLRHGWLVHDFFRAPSANTFSNLMIFLQRHASGNSSAEPEGCQQSLRAVSAITFYAPRALIEP